MDQLEISGRDCHDHGDGHGDHGSSGDKTCPMIMRFHAGHCETILWSGWVAFTVTEFVFSAIAIFVISFLYEALKFWRAQLLRKEARRRIELRARSSQSGVECNGGTMGSESTALAVNQERSLSEKIFNSTHVIQSLINLLQITVSYWLMLIFMLFNYWLCLAVILGLGLGYFCFGWLKNDPQESECCP